MKRIMKWMKKQAGQWLFLVILLLGGLIFVHVTGQGTALVKPYTEAGEWVRTGLGTWERLPLIEAIRNRLGWSREPKADTPAHMWGPVSGGDSAEAVSPSISGNEAAVTEPVPTEPALTDPAQSQNPPREEVPSEPVYMHVEDDYFADALFIGDSRTVGLSKYGDIENVATFYASTGLTIFKLFEAPPAENSPDKTLPTLEDALTQKQFGKIYLMIGINEMGRGDVDGFIKTYEEAVARLRELQPNAIIYLQGIMRVSAKRDAKGDYIHNAGINERNERIAALADNQRIFYLDVNPLLCDEEGYLIEEYSFDGVHLLGKYYVLWKDFLKDHAVVLD